MSIDFNANRTLVPTLKLENATPLEATAAGMENILGQARSFLY